MALAALVGLGPPVSCCPDGDDVLLLVVRIDTKAPLVASAVAVAARSVVLANAAVVEVAKVLSVVACDNPVLKGQVRGVRE